MKLKTISAKALKGRTFTHGLADLTVIAGPNDTGKTAVADAITLALLGHLPGQPKTNVGIFGLASGSRMNVEAILEGRMPVRREWTRKGKAVTTTEEGVDDLPATPLIVLDPREYFGGSAKQQVEMIFALCPLDEAAAHKATAKATAEVNTLLAPHGLNVCGPDKQTPQAWFDTTLDWLGDELSKANADVKRMTQTQQGIAALGAQETTVDPAAVEAELKTARAKVEALVKAEAELTQRAKTAEATATRRRELVSIIQDLDTQLGDATPRSIEAINPELAGALKRQSDAEARVRQVEQAKARLGDITVALTKAREQAAGLPTLTDQVAELLTATGLPLPDPSEVRRATARAREAVAEIQRQQRTCDEALATAVKKANRLLETKCCPECGQQGEDFTALIEAGLAHTRQEHAAVVAKIAGDYELATQALTAAEANENLVLRKHDERTKAEKQLGDARMALQRAEAAREHVAGLTAEQERLLGTGDAPDPAPIAAEVQRLTQEQRMALLDGQRQQARADLARITATEDGEALATELAHVEQDLDAAREAVIALDQRKRHAEQQLSDAKRRQQAEDERTKAEASVKAIKAAQTTMQDAREKLVQSALDPILRTANTFTAGILPTPLEFRDGELGRFSDAGWIAARCFGGTHTAVTYAGIQAALGSKAPSRIVIVDELGRFDVANKTLFVDNVRKALDAGLIEQFIGLDVDPEFYRSTAGNGLQLIATAS